MLGVKPERCLVVEDAEAGIQAAKAGGFASAGIGNGAAVAGPDYLISGLGELGKICLDQIKNGCE